MSNTITVPTSFKSRPLPKEHRYWEMVRDHAKALDADGCTGVPEFYHLACLEHDIAYRTHKWVDGTPITKSEADKRFRLVMQAWSIFGIFSPMSWWRWLAVKLIARKAWENL